MSHLPPIDADMAGLLERLDPPRFSADFADRVLAAAEALPPAALPPLRKPAWRRRAVVAIAAGSLLSVAAAAAIAPEALRKVPVIGEIVDWVIPANEPAPHSGDVTPVPENPSLPSSEPLAEIADRLIDAAPAEPLEVGSQAEIPEIQLVAPVPVPLRAPDRPPESMRDARAHAAVMEAVPERTSTRENSVQPEAEVVEPQRVEETTEQVSRLVEADAEAVRTADVPEAAEVAPVREVMVERSDAAGLIETRRVPLENRTAVPARPALPPRPERLRSPRPRTEPRPRIPPRGR